MLLGKTSEVQKPKKIYKDSQGDIFLASNKQVGMHTKNIDICHHFLRYTVEENYIGIKFISSKEKPEEIISKNCYEADHVKGI